ncbi:MAG: 4-(cytidine 5'-diphospho)-2-C-methyl-D-erythritol kinase [Rhodothermales bacterium]
MILERNAPAKVNLGLHVLRKRDDGYHDIETVFLPVQWCDQVRVQPAEHMQFTCSDPGLPVDASNLCVRAANILRKHYGLDKAAAIHLEKHLPYGAGLGGGSSDAAQTLCLLNELWQLDLNYTTLHAFAAELGSDVPFFLHEDAVYATGRGELLEPLLEPGPGAKYEFPYVIVLVVPPVHVSTALAYQNIQPNDEERADLKTVVFSNNLSRWRTELVNDFETSVFTAYPELNELKQALINAGAGYAAMSGSGSSLFGVFEDANKAKQATQLFTVQGMTTWVSG